MRKLSFKNKPSLFLGILSVLVIFLTSYIITARLFEHAGYNTFARSTAFIKPASEEIVIIVIDDKSLAQIGRWPWKRTNFGEIFEYVNFHTDAKIIGFDALLTSLDVENPNSDKQFFEELKKFNKLVAGVGFHDFSNPENNREDKLYAKNNIKIKDERSKKHKQQSFFKSFSNFPQAYFDNIKSFGSVNTSQDNDGYIRRIDQVIDYKGRLYPSLSLVMYSKLTGQKEFTLTDKFLTDGKDLEIPVEHRYGIAHNKIKYYPLEYGSYSHINISASDVINSLRAIKRGEKPLLDAKIFKDKIVFVGANANAQALADIKRTPMSDLHPGVDIQATNLDNILHNTFLQKINPLLNLAIITVILFLTFIAIQRFTIPIALTLTASIIITYFILTIWLFASSYTVNIVPPLVFLAITVAFGYIYRYLSEGRKKEKITAAMGKYISKDVMQNVVENIDNIKLGGKKAEITVLFADIRDFTSISEKLSAEEVSEILNEYFSEIVPIIERHNGVLNKFMGDAVLAIFGEPIRLKNHAENAVKCADKMLKKVKYLQRKWLEEGKPRIEIGIGISTGEAFVGNIGSENRLEYTVIGDTVNTASRIENYNKIYKTNFLISQETYRHVADIADVIKIREVTIRGKSHKMNIYEVLRIVADD